MREHLDEANKAPMIDRPRWVAWAAFTLLVLAGLALLATVGLGHHHH